MESSGMAAKVKEISAKTDEIYWGSIFNRPMFIRT
jgi:hypothetical protein